MYVVQMIKIFSATLPFTHLSIMDIPFEVDFERTNLNLGDDTESIDVQSLIDSPSYELAFQDPAFIMSDTARALRLHMETVKPEWILRQYGIRSTVIVFGSARFVSGNKARRLLSEAEATLAASPNDTDLKDAVAKAVKQVEMSAYYDQAREFARIVSEENQANQPLDGK